MLGMVIPGAVNLLAGKIFDIVLGERRVERERSDQRDANRLLRIFKGHDVTVTKRNADLIEDLRDLGECIYDRGGEPAMKRVYQVAFPDDGDPACFDQIACIDVAWHAIGGNVSWFRFKGVWVK